MRRSPTAAGISFLFLLLCGAGRLSATQTAFWRPYGPDPRLYGLFQFDTGLIQSSGRIASGTAVGDAAPEPAGKFGGALRVSGNGAVRFLPSETFSGGSVSIEAWAKLDRYPEKEGWIVFRPGVVDGNASVFDPEKDRSFGFGLAVDSKGALHLQVTNTFYGWTIRTSSDPGAVPLGRWVHLAGISSGYRRLYVDGRLVREIATGWGQGLMGSEKEAQPVFVGNDAKGGAGVCGALDDVRIHTAVFELWEREDLSWAAGAIGRPVPEGAPHFLEGNRPVVRLPLDGRTDPDTPAVAGLKVAAPKAVFVEGVRNAALQGTVTVSAPGLLDAREGSVEFWFEPVGWYNYPDFGWGIMSASNCFNMYIFNSGAVQFNPLSVYFYSDGAARFVNDGLSTGFHEGTWYHVVYTWKGRDLVLYVNGRPAGRTSDRPMPGTAVGEVAFGGSNRFDEIRLYRTALTKDEAYNAWARYRQPGDLKTVRSMPAILEARYLPSRAALIWRATPNIPKERISGMSLLLEDERKSLLWRWDGRFEEGERTVKIPPLKDGNHFLTLLVAEGGGSPRESGTVVVPRMRFPWENNQLGVTDRVYPPFEPVKVAGASVSIVGRTYHMNGFGLWDRVVSKGRDILAAPAAVRYETAAGEGAWSSVDGAFRKPHPDYAEYAGRARSGAVVVSSSSTVEPDGCMRVEMELAPGARPEEIRRLWLDIPLKEREAPLFHSMVDGLRSNYSGATPAGTGVVWDGSTASRGTAWRNLFVSYAWLGGEERGIAWFAENDRGWVTEKGKSKRPLVEIVREPGRVSLRVYFVNRPATIAEKRRFVFGVQASPTKPMPAGWRLALPDMPGGLPVVPWGGLHCAYQGPYRDDWAIVDKMLEARASGKVDRAWFVEYDKAHTPPPAFGTWPWLESALWFAGRCAQLGVTKPVPVYQEEMGASTVRREWETFRDEWGQEPFFRKGEFLSEKDRAALRPPAEWPDEGVFRRKVNASPGGGTNFIRSYQDFGCWFANEWLKRGVTLYWDNTFPHVSHDPATSEAYLAEDGAVQPAVLVWNQREYQKRVWNLLQYWRERRPEPIEWVLHMTNTFILPIHTWGTVNLDHELARATPFPPDWLRTETIGLQMGNYPLSLYEVYGRNNKAVLALPEERRGRVEWGMRAVHEIQHSGPLSKILFDYGYGKPEVAVHRYWEEPPPAAVSNDEVKWMLLSRAEAKSLIMVLASWSEKDAEATVSFSVPNLGFSAAGRRVLDAESGETIAADGRSPFAVKLPGPYGVRILKLE